MKTETGRNYQTLTPTGNDFANQMDRCIERNQTKQSGFFIVIIQLANLVEFKKRRSPAMVRQMMSEIGRAVRRAVHPSQYVGFFQDGIGLIFDGVDSGNVDQIVAKVTVLVQHTIRQGHYNDLSARWTDIIYQFLHPQNPGMVFPVSGWAIYPRDGENMKTLTRRALLHIEERERKKDA